MNNDDEYIRPPDAVRREQLMPVASAPPMPADMAADIELTAALDESRRIAEEMEYMAAISQIAELEAAEKMTRRRAALLPLRTKLNRLRTLGDPQISAVYDELEISFETWILNDEKITPSSACTAALQGIRLSTDERGLISTVFTTTAT